MKIVAGACAALVAASLAACGSSAGDAATTGVARDTKAAASGLGYWSTTTPAGVKATVKVTANEGDDTLIADAERCREALGGAPTTWVLLEIDATASTEDATTTTGTIVTNDGTAVEISSAVTAVGTWYGDAPESEARQDCVATNQTLGDNQGVVPAGAKGTAVFTADTPVPSAKSVTLYVGGVETPLTYTG